MKNQIANFPEEVKAKMLERQVEQGNQRNIKVFEANKRSDKTEGGFSWFVTVEKVSFWDNVICHERFDIFYAKYPKTSGYPKVMLVSDNNNINHSIERVVFMEKNGMFLTWFKAKTIAESEETADVSTWKYAWDISVKQVSVKEVTIDEIAEKFGVNPKNLKIIK
jgi:hypothetical protein